MRLLAILLFIGVFFSCEEENGMTISQEKITAMMGDMLLAESAINRVNRSESDSISSLYYQQIYIIHNVDSAEFAKNLELISKDPNLSAAIYQAVEDRMSGKLEAIKEDEKKEKEDKDKKKSIEDKGDKESVVEKKKRTEKAVKN